MKEKTVLIRMFLLVAIVTAMTLGIYSFAAAHCDTWDGPVVQDARKALENKDVTPILKWVKQKDEKAVRAEFAKALSAKGKKNADTAENKFFAALVKIHRAGEGAPFTGLKPAGEVEPAIAEADKTLAGGSVEALVKLVAEDVAAGIRNRYEHASATYIHKDESVEQGREFVDAYVTYTHYVERLHLDAMGNVAHKEHSKGSNNPSDKHHTQARELNNAWFKKTIIKEYKMKITRVSEETTFKNPHKIQAKKILESPDAIVVHMTLNPGESLISHKTPVDVFFYVLAGEPTIEIGDEREKVSADSIIESPADIPHRVYNDSEMTARFLVVKLSKSK